MTKIKAVIKHQWKHAVYMLLGNLGYALALDLFLAGNGISGGGFAGIGTVLNYVIDFPIGLFTFLMSIPLFIFAFFVYGWRFVLITALASAVYSVMVDALAFLPTLTDNMLLASAAGGLIYAVSAVLFLRSGGSCGGTDLLARLLLIKFPGVSLGTMYIIVEGLIIVSVVAVSGRIEMGIYAIICIAICSIGTDYIIHGVNRASIFFIITGSDPKPIADAVIYGMERGVTRIAGTGMYAGVEKNILMVVVKPREVYKVKEIVRKCDPDAFVVMSNASEIMGLGFSGIDTVTSGKEK